MKCFVLRRSIGRIDLSRYANLLKSNQVIEKYIPREFIRPEPLQKLAGSSVIHPDYQSYNKGISDPTWDMLDRGGKLWRSALCMITCEALGGKPEEVLNIAASLELFHNGSLICDDIEDASEMRRGKPCIYKLYGMNISVNLGCMHYAMALSILNDMEASPEMLLELNRRYIEEFNCIHLGQCSDIMWSNLNLIPTENEYLQMIINKTSVLARLSVILACTLKKAPIEVENAFKNYAVNIGIAFQIRDDLKNLESEEYAKGRSYIGEDITEGKKTIIVLRALQQQNPTNRQRLIDILGQRSSDQQLVKEALDIIFSTDAILYSHKVIQEKVEQGWGPLQKILPESEGKNKLEQLANFLAYENL